MADVMIRLAGRDYPLRPTFGAMREIEAQTGSSCATLYGLLARQELHLGEAAKIVFYGMEAGGEKPSDWEAVGNRLFEERIASQHIRDSIAGYLLALLYAPETARKKLDGEWLENEAITSPNFSSPHTASDGDPETSGQPLPESSGPSSKPSVKNPSGSKQKGEK